MRKKRKMQRVLHFCLFLFSIVLCVDEKYTEFSFGGWINLEKTKPRFSSLKKEITNLDPDFKRMRLSFRQWKDLIAEIKVLSKTNEGKKAREGKLTNSGEGFFYFRMSLLDLLVIKLYTNFNSLQKNVKRAFREYNEENPSKICRSYFHWWKLLGITVNFFGTKNEDSIFYHGISETMIVNSLNYINANLMVSLTSEFEVATNFASFVCVCVCFSNETKNIFGCLLDFGI